MRARWAVVAGVVLGLLGLLVPSAAGAVTSASAPATAPVRLGPAYVTDHASVLSSSDLSALDERLEKLSTAKGIQLFVVLVDDFTDPSDRQRWADQVASQNGLGSSQYLLAIAVQGRQYYISADKSGPVPMDRIDTIEQSLANDLHSERWADAVRTAADGFQGSGSSSGSGSGLGGIVFVVILLVAIGVAIWVIVAVQRRKKRAALPAGADADPLAALSDAELEKRAGSALVHTDDAVTSSTEDLGFATAQFGEGSTAAFTEVVARAKAGLDQAFALKQKLDDEIPDTREQRRAWHIEIIRLCEQADAALDANVAAFDELRRLEQNAEQALQQLVAARAAAGSAAEAAPAALQALLAVYDPSALQTVADNPQQAQSRLQLADAHIAEAQQLLGTGKRGEAAFAIRTAEEGVVQAQQLAAAIDGLRADLGAAEDQARALIADLEQDVAGAAALPSTPELVAAVGAVRGQLDEARTNLSGSARRPEAVRDALAAVNTRIDATLGQIRDAQQRAERARQVLAQTILQARSEVSAANDFIATRRGAVGATARTRAAEAAAALDRAEAAAQTDPEGALQNAERATALAREASSAARSDVSGWNDDSGWGGGGRGGSGGNDLAGDIIGGIIGGIIAGGARSGGSRSGGWGGSGSSSGWRSSGGGRGFSPSSFGGGGRGRSGGGRF